MRIEGENCFVKILHELVQLFLNLLALRMSRAFLLKYIPNMKGEYEKLKLVSGNIQISVHSIIFILKMQLDAGKDYL